MNLEAVVHESRESAFSSLKIISGRDKNIQVISQVLAR